MIKIRKITAIILTLLLIPALSMNAFATDIPVNNIVIDIDSEIAGKTPDDYEDYVSFTANGLQFRDENTVTTRAELVLRYPKKINTPSLIISPANLLKAMLYL